MAAAHYVAGRFQPAQFGGFAEALDLGLGLYLNGEIGNSSQDSLKSMDNFRAFLPGLVIVDTAGHTAKILSTDALKDTPRARHRAVYVPGIGEKGIFVTFGGVTKSVYDGSASSRGTYVWTISLLSMYNQLTD